VTALQPTVATSQGVAIDDGPAGRPAPIPPRALSMLPNSLALIGAKVATLGLGFLFWLVAARFYAPDVVGLAAGVVAAVLLCTQLALFGVGSAVITLLPKDREHPARLIDNAITLTTLTGLAVGMLFVALAAGMFPELGAVGRSPAYAALFGVMSALGTVGIVLDQTSTTLRRGDHALARGVLNGVLSLAALALLVLAPARWPSSPAGSWAAPPRACSARSNSPAPCSATATAYA
jgi:O-antigen/teichoic acid export membrane protein